MATIQSPMIEDVVSAGSSSITDSNLADLHPREDVPEGHSRMFGRNIEKQAILNAYHRMRQTGDKEIIVVHGVSGSGKTSLVDTLREPVFASQGYVCAGKFFQNAVVEPYSAIMAAFSDLCDLISQSDDFEERRQEILPALGEDGNLLAKLVTSLSPFLDPATESGDFIAEAALTMFMVACKTFLSVMSCPNHPVVLVLDDIQWMDCSSRRLIQILMDDNELKNVLMILIYRDEESSWVESLFDETNAKKLIDIQLHSFDCDVVHEIILFLLKAAPSDSTMALAKLVMTRTEGNPLHVNLFLEFLEQENLLKYNRERNAWEYQVETIRRETMLSETLADVLAQKIQRLSPAVQGALRVASLIGFHFIPSILSNVIYFLRQQQVDEMVAASDQDVGVLLDQAVAGRLIEQTSTGFQFSHDKLQSSFQSMMNETEVAKSHRAIGETYLRLGDAESHYLAAIHLNRAGRLTSETMIPMARLNLEASQYCKDKSAFVEAEALLQVALELIPAEERWTLHYHLSLAVVGSLAKASVVVGKFDLCKEMNNELLFHARSVDDKLDSLVTSVEVAIADNIRVTDCEIAVNRTLRVLGIKLPTKLSLAHVITKLLKVKCLLLRKTDEFILGMPIMTDRAKSTAMRLLIYGAIFGLNNNNEKHAIYCALMTIELTVKVGLSKSSPSAFAIYSMAELVMGNLDRAYRFGNLSKMLAAQLGSKLSGAVAELLVNNMVSHWRETLLSLAQRTKTAMNSCLEAGDYNFGIFGTAIVSGFRTCMGENLLELEHFFRHVHSRFKSFNHHGSNRFYEPNFQFVLNLIYVGDQNWGSLTELSGEIMVEDEFILAVIADNREVLLSLLWILKIQLTYLFGFCHKGVSVLRDMEAFRKILRYGFNYSRWRLFGGLICYQRYRETLKGKYLRKARSFKRSFYIKDVAECPNSSPLLKLLLAEEESVKSKQDVGRTVALYEEAIKNFSNAKLVHLEALANERAAFFLCASNDGIASQYFERAMYLYIDEWGSTSKYEHLKEISTRCLAKFTPMSFIGPCSVIELREGISPPGVDEMMLNTETNPR